MYVIMLNGQKYSWKPKDNKRKDNKNCSSYHIIARHLLHQLFPTTNILEEASFTINPGKKLYFDFYIPLFSLAVEIHGKQHYAFSHHFHNNKLNFLHHQKRDREKQEWCDLNDIQLIILPYNENEDEWKIRINQRSN